MPGFLALVLCSAILPTDSIPQKPEPKGPRLLGLQVGPARDEDYGKAFAKAREAGIQVVGLHLAWDDIEKQPGQFEGEWLEVADGFYPSRGTMVAIDIASIDTNRDRRPSDLKGLSFDDPKVTDRFAKLLAFVKSKTTHLGVPWLSVGNEVDVILQDDPAKWQAYSGFFKSAKAAAKRLWPTRKVGVKVTFDSQFDGRAKVAISLEREADLVLTTYYATNPDFSFKSPSSVITDFKALCDLYPGKRIDLAEIGYPSSSAVGSSELRQAEFVGQAFAAWDKHLGQIGMFLWQWHTDMSPEAIKSMGSYYGSSDARFLGFLGSLGLRSWEGKEKPAFREFVKQANARGWK